jgi:hypothetical protein
MFRNLGLIVLLTITVLFVCVLTEYCVLELKAFRSMVQTITAIISCRIKHLSWIVSNMISLQYKNHELVIDIQIPPHAYLKAG